MGIATDYGRKGFTYIQNVDPPAGASPGDTWFNSDVYKAYMFNGSDWQQIFATDQDTSTPGSRGVFGGGGENSVNTIDYININSFGNATDFGDLTLDRYGTSSCSNGTNDRGIFYTGNKTGAGTPSNIIDYITISSTGDATDFGDVTTARLYPSGVSNGTSERGVFGGGSAISYYNVIDYITISSTGNAADFGDLSDITFGVGSCSNGVNDRGVFAGGKINTGSLWRNNIEYITISSTGNAADFGDLSGERDLGGSCSDDINDRGIFAGGRETTGSVNTIEYITISTTGNSSDFGDLTNVRINVPAGCSNGINDRGVFAGGYGVDPSTKINNIDYIAISSAGNSADFGDLTISRGLLGACSNGAL